MKRPALPLRARNFLYNATVAVVGIAAAAGMAYLAVVALLPVLAVLAPAFGGIVSAALHELVTSPQAKADRAENAALRQQVARHGSTAGAIEARGKTTVADRYGPTGGSATTDRTR